MRVGRIVPAEWPGGSCRERQDRIDLVPVLGQIGLEVALGKGEPRGAQYVVLCDTPEEVVLEPFLGHDAHEQGLELGDGLRALALLDEALERQHPASPMLPS